MRAKRLVATLLGAIAIALIAGCGSAPSPTLSPIASPVSPLPTDTLEPSPPSKLIFVGTVGEVAAPDRVLVTDSGSNEVWITVSEATRLFRVMEDATRPVAFEALQPGQQVEIELDAPLRKSDPMQAGALQITITGSGAPTSAVPESAPIVQVVMQVLRQQLADSSKQVSFVRAEAIDWPDACIGISAKDVMCAQVITPGYRVVLAVDGVQVVYHTDRDGSRVLLASGPEVRVPDAAISWRGEGARGCTEAALGSEVVAFSPCGGAQMAGVYTRADRAEAYATYVATYAPFEAQTPAGTVSLAGQGMQQATPAEQRMIAEWARWATIEAAQGRSGASYGFAMGWRRIGGIAGFCDTLEVYRTGDVFAGSCAGQEPRTLGHGYLSGAEAEQLFAWLDALEGFEAARSDGAVADSMTVSLRFAGEGGGARSAADEDAMLELAAALFTRVTQE